jgi:hypothetical protein
MSSDDDDLILGVISPLRFMQGAAMSPAATLLGFVAGADYHWLGVSFGVAGVVLFVILVVKGHLDKRPLPWQLYLLLVVQLVVTVWTIAVWRGLV